MIETISKYLFYKNGICTSCLLTQTLFQIMAVLILFIITNKTTFIFGLLSLFNSILNLFPNFTLFCFNSLSHAILFHSLNLCHSAICFLGQFMTSFQWCNSWPELFPPISSRPITSFLVILSQSMTRNSMLMFCKPSL